MSYREVHYSWEYNLKSTPEQLWPFVSDTNRFNRDTGVPSVEPSQGKRQRLRNARRRLRLSFYGFAVEWEEQPFEWVRPLRFGVARKYSKGPVAELRALAELTPLESGGTRLKYEVWVRPQTLLGSIAIPLQMKFLTAPKFARTFRKYDEAASVGVLAATNDEPGELSPAALGRIESVREKLLAEEVSPDLVTRLLEFVQQGDDFSVARIRPYELADDWKASRKDVLAACLRATRAGLLDLQWDLMCPLCRGAAETGTSLRDINSKVHCEACRIDFKANFDRFVEITFRPNASVRFVETKTFCIGSPHKSPHVVAQQLMPPRTDRLVSLALEPGKYRLRALELDGERRIGVSDDGNASESLNISGPDWGHGELSLSTKAALQMRNSTDSEQLLILERTAWTDQAATAAEVTALQVFRDLFSTEALRPGEQISVGTLTVLFTDLRNSTRLYREIGDATAFGRVMNHFDALKKVIADNDGALVKTIGDAVMAVFRSPANALRAMLDVQEILASPADGSMPLTLKAGLHTGPCIAVTLNDRLDYFGSTVNMAARLEGLSTGSDVIISDAVYGDAEVRELIGSEDNLSATQFDVELKGFVEERFRLWRVKKEASVTAEASGAMN
jgi:class 3 adenylate cyclase